MNLFRLKPALLSLLLFWQMPYGPTATSNHFRFQRTLSIPTPLAAPAPNQDCAILDAQIFAHAAPALKDLRLFSGAVEIPYSTAVIEPPQQDTDEARILNARAEHGHIVFDLEMPHRPYTGVHLDLAARDFIATATAFGDTARSFKNAVSLGSFTLFDLTSQHLFRDTDIPLTESNFPFLRVELSLIPAPGRAPSASSLNLPSVVASANVPPSREGQSLYTATQPASAMVQAGDESIAAFKVPARVPIERIHFSLPPGNKGSFSREVRIEARGVSGDGPEALDDPSSSDGFSSESALGTILSVHKSEAGHDLSVEDLSVPVAIGSNMQQSASVKVHVQNGSEGSLPLSVQLQMRQRRICFDSALVKAPLMLFYGDPSIDAPEGGDPTVLPVAASAVRLLQLGPETVNPAFSATLSTRRLIGQRPVLRWIALLGCVCIFALLVIRSTHKRRR